MDKGLEMGVFFWQVVGSVMTKDEHDQFFKFAKIKPLVFHGLE